MQTVVDVNLFYSCNSNLPKQSTRCESLSCRIKLKVQYYENIFYFKHRNLCFASRTLKLLELKLLSRKKKENYEKCEKGFNEIAIVFCCWQLFCCNNLRLKILQLEDIICHTDIITKYNNSESIIADC